MGFIFLIIDYQYFIWTISPMQHIRPVDYQYFMNKMVKKSVFYFFLFAERVQN